MYILTLKRNPHYVYKSTDNNTKFGCHSGHIGITKHMKYYYLFLLPSLPLSSRLSLWPSIDLLAFEVNFSPDLDLDLFDLSLDFDLLILSFEFDLLTLSLVLGVTVLSDTKSSFFASVKRSLDFSLVDSDISFFLDFLALCGFDSGMPSFFLEKFWKIMQSSNKTRLS